MVTAMERKSYGITAFIYSDDLHIIIHLQRLMPKVKKELKNHNEIIGILNIVSAAAGKYY